MTPLTKPRATPPLLPSRRARLEAIQASAREALASVPAGTGVGMFNRPVDTSAVDAGWPAAGMAPSPLEALAALVRARRTGRAIPAQAAARTAVARFLGAAGLSSARCGNVVFHLGADRYVAAGDGFVARAGALRVTLEKPARGHGGGKPAAGASKAKTAEGVNLDRVRGLVRDAAQAAKLGVAAPAAVE